MHDSIKSRLGAVLGAMLVLTASAGVLEQPLNILFLGNSLTQNSDVPGAMSAIATTAGHPAPTMKRQILWGLPLTNHIIVISTAAPNDIIRASLPSTQNWDFVVLQDYMDDEKTYGGPTWPQKTVSNSQTLAGWAFERSSNAVIVMYQWGGRSNDQPASCTNLHTAYAAARDNIRVVFGASKAVLSPSGDAWKHEGYQNLYADGLHQNNRGALLSAMVLYGTMYKDPAITAINGTNFATTSWAVSQAITLADWLDLAPHAEAVLPEPFAAALALALALAVTRSKRL